MPEQLSKHPEVTMQVLQGAGGRCGPAFQPKILTKCPPQRFCAFDSGEICVYGLQQIAQMTQLSAEELAAAVCGPRPEALPDGPAGAQAGALGIAFVLGLGLGALYMRLRRR